MAAYAKHVPLKNYRVDIFRGCKKLRQVFNCTKYSRKRTHRNVDKAPLCVEWKFGKVHTAGEFKGKSNRHEHFCVICYGKVVGRREDVGNFAIDAIAEVGVGHPKSLAPTVTQFVLRKRFLRREVDTLGNGILIGRFLKPVVSLTI